MSNQCISLVIPIYKNEENLSDLFSMIKKQESEFRNIECKLEAIFVVDGSPDNCLEMIIRAKEEKKIPSNTVILELSRNFGQVQALNAGVSVSTGNAAICYSADMQDPPELFLEMYKAYRLGNEIVLAARLSREDNFLQNLTSKIGYGILRRDQPNIPRGGFDFFLIGNQAKGYLTQRNGSRRFLQGDLLNLGFSPVVLSYKRRKRVIGRSSYTFRKRLAVFADAFYDSSDLPIKLSTRTGFIVSSLGFISAIYMLANYLIGKTPFNGFTALITSILILGGIQLMVLGIIGEYISRIFDVSRNRPNYIIKNIF
jgi:polyisoprenyl-phosphate glycosyltransferase